ncbi:DNA-methyltransferase [Xylophilus ampelinus]|uniref:Methyltransferase n=1 Tax=Xylophilus ampelinus TaxID=54067 RepID=A0A318SLW2_9BURK|nr:site-specific DNA-methyltransferase [Xylophilus ampelinus]MCS4508922.1 site-specific DNA-methyltransferase [Xylophilus ampelinus]PYE79488.1 site-specific DNA-methyltransferase (adenine-specific) [Xylophilus ampelinus]
MNFELHRGDNLAALLTMADASVDAVVTDPPYGLSHEPDMAEVLRHWLAGDDYQHRGGGFMGKAWDSFVPGPSIWRECLRVLKPGGHLMSFFGSRTYDMGVLAIRLAGFEVRDQIMWVYGSGFPKSSNQGGDWEGWGTALKPAHEPICMARKPLVGTVAANLIQHATGALNIDACRIDGEPMAPNTGAGGIPARHNDGELRPAGVVTQPHALGRWPANLIHDGSDEVRAAFPDSNGQQGDLKNHGSARQSPNGIFGGMRPALDHPARVESDKSAARFFYCAKPSRTDRNEGCDELPQRAGGMVSNTSGQHMTRRDGYEPAAVGNHHPTVKPTDLMAYLCRLVTPPGGLVLDPFMGSGSTGKACMREGFRFIGCEQEQEYLAIARARIEAEHCKAIERMAAAARRPVVRDLFSEAA